MSFTDTFETRVLTWVFTASSATRPTAWFVALYTAAPNDAGGGTEVSGAGYVRKAATFTVSGDTASNSGAIEYPTATGNYGTVSHVGIFDALSGGNLIAYAALTVSKTISTGDVLRIPAGDLDVTLS
mgnify:CR=1 FL=1|tara:strand:+ start:156 stop:536 length:381 start_codon:yes stop_codon:yes gene_type:complete